MIVDAYDFVTVGGDYVTVDLIVWRRYRAVTYGVYEQMLEDNPHLAEIHRTSPFLPVGTQVRVPINYDMLKGTPQTKSVIKFVEPMTRQNTAEELL
jgi:phage tail protein X